MFRAREQTKEPPLAASYQKGLTPSDADAVKFGPKLHQHTLSDSTAGSNNSSPTTTISTVDDSSATEPSPGSSPESPPPNTFAAGMVRPRTSDGSPFFELQKEPPPRKGRNLKNLAVNTSRPPNRAASTPSLPLPNANLPAQGVASPSFVKPPTPPRRKAPSNLGLAIQTPDSGKAAPQEIRLAIPPTPGLGRPATLRHFQSSPSLPLCQEFDSEASIAPQVARARALQPLETILSPSIAPEQKSLVVEQEEEQNFDVPLSKEEKPEAYPDGPICVYEPYVDLYLEPTTQQAMQYDVIMNVANEVRNPFVEQMAPATAEPEVRMDGGGGIQYAPKRDFQPESRPTREGSPTTPKATPVDGETPNIQDLAITSKKEPEYIHIKWDHNSDIVPDLLRLVKLIDEKVAQRQRILVHCQCGVSRSASLVVAYGLYKNPSLSVQDAYDAVKNRSKWIGPNMNLIMQLQEFRSSLLRNGVVLGNRGSAPLAPSALGDWRSARGKDAPLSAGAGPLTVSQTAESLPAVSPGPSSAPSGLSWPVKDEKAGRSRAVSAVKPGTAFVNPSGRVVPAVGPVLHVVAPQTSKDVSSPPPLRLQTPQAPSPPQPKRERPSDSDSATPTEPFSPRAEEFAMAPLQPSTAVDPDDRYGLMSPTSTDFSHSPFDRSALLAQLGMGSVKQEDDLASHHPRRSVSLRSPTTTKPPPDTSRHAPRAPPRLRGKISSPSLKEQRELQRLQMKIEASLPHRTSPPPVPPMPTFASGTPVPLSSQPPADDDNILASPRATQLTQNPFALALEQMKQHGPPASLAAAAAASAPQQVQPTQEETSAAAPAAAHTRDEEQAAGPLPAPSPAQAQPGGLSADPRSPGVTGASPITRNIMDVL